MSKEKEGTTDVPHAEEQNNSEPYQGPTLTGENLRGQTGYGKALASGGFRFVRRVWAKAILGSIYFSRKIKTNDHTRSCRTVFRRREENHHGGRSFEYASRKHLNRDQGSERNGFHSRGGTPKL